MPISNSILGMNARNFLYIRKYNPGSAKKRADNKLSAKRMLIRNEIPTTALVTAFPDRESVRSFSWDLPENGFVLKPARGYGGEGIVVFKNWRNGIGETISGTSYDIKALESHILDIFEGVYSLQALPDAAYVEERVIVHPFFRKIVPIGLPDIRIIVFNKVPIMAMLRLPTEESKGKANLHLGAVGVGIDMKTGITTHAIYRNKHVSFIPGTKTKIRGIKIPLWDEMLLLAVKTQDVSRLGYTGVDVVLDANKGPLVLEINSRPGLAIQNANLASMRSRLERVENLNIQSYQRGIEVAKSLFAEEFAHKVDTAPKVLGVIEPITIIHEGVASTCEAKLDTGAYRTSLDAELVKELQLPILAEKIFIKSASGQQYRSAVKVQFMLADRKISTTATVAKRSHLQYPAIIGRRDLKGFLINPERPQDAEDYGEEAL